MRTPSLVPIAAIVVLAAGAAGVSADPGERGAESSGRPIAARGRLHVAPPSRTSPVDLTASPVVHATRAPVVVPTNVALPPALRVVGWTALPFVPPTTLPVRADGPAPVRADGPAPVSLGAAGAFAILTKSGVTDVPGSTIRGNVGASPIAGAAIGLSCPEVTGKIYSVNVAGTPACRVMDATGLTAAVSDEESAYTDAAGRTNPGFVNLGAGQIGGLTLSPGLYKWTGDVSMSKGVTLAGGPNDVWIFQIAGSLNQASATRVRLTGGALAKNVFWASAGAVTLGTTAHSEGTILSKTMIAMNTGSSTNGRLLAQTQVTLQESTVNNVQ